jgi:hypothetical protein
MLPKKKKKREEKAAAHWCFKVCSPYSIILEKHLGWRAESLLKVNQIIGK